GSKYPTSRPRKKFRPSTSTTSRSMCPVSCIAFSFENCAAGVSATQLIFHPVSFSNGSPYAFFAASIMDPPYVDTTRICDCASTSRLVARPTPNSAATSTAPTTLTTQRFLISCPPFGPADSRRDHRRGAEAQGCPAGTTRDLRLTVPLPPGAGER